MARVTTFTNLKACTMAGNDYGMIDDAAIVVTEGRIVAIGERKAIQHKSDQTIDLQGALVTPGLIDCHTHIVHAGHRANEFEMRLNGASYTDIANAGGGILSTVKATRAATDEQLLMQSRYRAEALMADGVTTVEIKSGYGLDHANEIKMLRVARQLGAQLPVNVQTTFLGAHALPPEFAGRADDYIDHLCNVVLPDAQALGLVDAVDVFCEKIGFSLEQSRRMLQRARDLQLPLKIHAEQLSDLKGTRMAAELGALSSDHIEFLSVDDIPVMKQHGTVAVLLPGAFYFLRETQLPPIAALRENGVPIAIASDSNPGSSPTYSLLLMLNMACTLFRLTPLEALQGVTVNGAKALGVHKDRGTLSVGMRADMALFNVEHPAELCYRIGDNCCIGRVFNGQLLSNIHF